jgi:hypothetical protein
MKLYDLTIMVGLAVALILLAGCLYVMVEKVECFADPCTQCMRAGYLCTNPYKVNWEDVNETFSKEIQSSKGSS